MKHRFTTGKPKCTVEYHDSIPVEDMQFAGEHVEEGYPPMRLYNFCPRCDASIVRAAPGRCNRCNELQHAGPC